MSANEDDVRRRIAESLRRTREASQRTIAKAPGVTVGEATPAEFQRARDGAMNSTFRQRAGAGQAAREFSNASVNDRLGQLRADRTARTAARATAPAAPVAPAASPAAAPSSIARPTPPAAPRPASVPTPPRAGAPATAGRSGPVRNGVAGVLGATGISSAVDSGLTPTSTFDKRLGIDSNAPAGPVANTIAGVLNSTPAGMVRSAVGAAPYDGELVRDIGSRTIGTLQNFGADVLDTATGVFNFGRVAAGEAPIETFRSILDGNQPAASATAAAPTPATGRTANPANIAAGPSMAIRDGATVTRTGAGTGADTIYKVERPGFATEYTNVLDQSVNLADRPATSGGVSYVENIVPPQRGTPATAPANTGMSDAEARAARQASSRAAELKRLTGLSEAALASGRRKTAGILAGLAGNYADGGQSLTAETLRQRRSAGEEGLAEAQAGLVNEQTALAQEQAAAARARREQMRSIFEMEDPTAQRAALANFARANGDLQITTVEVPGPVDPITGEATIFKLPFDATSGTILYDPREELERAKQEGAK